MLYLLRPLPNLNPNPWDPWYDKAFGFVVRAGDEKEARRVAYWECGSEGAEVWLSPSVTSCEILSPEGESGVIVRDLCKS